jgi:aldose 1-epimerase
MYQITHHRTPNYLEVENSATNLNAKVYLNDGASLQEFTLAGHQIIKDLSPLTYADTYASAVLFPFANRIKGGTYTFNNKTFQLEINQKEEQNALHGLVYNKTFTLIDSHANKDFASMTLEYNEANKSIGFPYTYSIQLEYVFNKAGFKLKVTAKNTDTKAFPFTLGWHPYFASSNLHESSIKLDSIRKTVLDKRNITTGLERIKTTETIEIKNQKFDDCWILNSNEVLFNTPKYRLKLSATGGTHFLQIYTPPKENTIAIEPTTGVSDSFNNQIGLKTLNPNDSYSITWSLHITNN